MDQKNKVEEKIIEDSQNIKDELRDIEETPLITKTNEEKNESKSLNNEGNTGKKENILGNIRADEKKIHSENVIDPSPSSGKKTSQGSNKDVESTDQKIQIPENEKKINIRKNSNEISNNQPETSEENNKLDDNKKDRETEIRENKSPETLKIQGNSEIKSRAEVIKNVNMATNVIYHIHNSKEEKQEKNSKEEVFEDPTRSLPKNPSKLSVFFSTKEIEEKTEMWKEERLILLSCHSEDILNTTAYKFIDKAEFGLYEKRMLSFDNRNSSRFDLNLDIFLQPQIRDGKKLIVFIDIDRKCPFFDSLFIGQMRAQDIKETFLQRDILLIGLLNPQLLKQARDEKEIKFSFAFWGIDFLPHLLKNYFPQNSDKLIKEVIRQREKGLWDRHSNDAEFYRLIYNYLKDGIEVFEDQVNKRSNIGKDKEKLTEYGIEYLSCDKKEVFSNKLFGVKDPDKTVLYVGTFFSGLTPSEFDIVVRELLEDRIIKLEKKKDVVTEGGIIQKIIEFEEVKAIEVWDKEADEILNRCQLLAQQASDGSHYIDFINPYLRGDLKKLIEESHPIFLRQQFQLIQDSDKLFFSPNVSENITENIIQLATYMALLNPVYYGTEWLKKFIYQVEAQFDRQLENTENLFVAILQFLEDEENEALQNHFYIQASKLIREMLNYQPLKEVVKNFFNDLFSNGGHDAILQIVLNVGKPLLFVQNSEFDLFYWIKRLLDQGPEYIKDGSYQALLGIAKERSFHIYDILKTIRMWLPDSEKKLDSFSPSNKYALIFIVNYCSGTLEKAKKKHKEKFYGQGLSIYPLFSSLHKDKIRKKEQLEIIIDWLLQPLLQEVIHNTHGKLAEDFIIEEYISALFEEWALMLLGKDFKKENFQEEEILMILIRKVILIVDRVRYRSLMNELIRRQIFYREVISEDEYRWDNTQKELLLVRYHIIKWLSRQFKNLKQNIQVEVKDESKLKS